MAVGIRSIIRIPMVNIYQKVGVKWPRPGYSIHVEGKVKKDSPCLIAANRDQLCKASQFLKACRMGELIFLYRNRKFVDWCFLIFLAPAICHPHWWVVPKRRLELPHPFGHMNLNHARLPIPPLRHIFSLYCEPLLKGVL